MTPRAFSAPFSAPLERDLLPRLGEDSRLLTRSERPVFPPLYCGSNWEEYRRAACTEHVPCYMQRTAFR